MADKQMPPKQDKGGHGGTGNRDPEQRGVNRNGKDSSPEDVARFNARQEAKKSGK